MKAVSLPFIAQKRLLDDSIAASSDAWLPQRHEGSPALSRFVLAEGHLCVTYDSTHDAEVAFGHDKSDVNETSQFAYVNDKKKVDAQTCQVIVLDANIASMTKFKHIIGRGTRINEKYGKLFFTILDFRNVNNLFADPAFDGDPILPPRTYGEDDELSKVIEGKKQLSAFLSIIYRVDGQKIKNLAIAVAFSIQNWVKNCFNLKNIFFRKNLTHFCKQIGERLNKTIEQKLFLNNRKCCSFNYFFIMHLFSPSSCVVV